MLTALLIGVGIFIMFCDLPAATKRQAFAFQWIPHIAIFALLTALHGGSAEGVVLAGVATLVFRLLLGRAAARHSQTELHANTPTSTLSAEEQGYRFLEIVLGSVLVLFLIAALL